MESRKRGRKMKGQGGKFKMIRKMRSRRWWSRKNGKQEKKREKMKREEEGRKDKEEVN